MNIVFVLLSFLLASQVECQGESITKAKRLAVAEETFDDNESFEETVESDSSSVSDDDFQDELESGNFSKPVVIKEKPGTKPEATPKPKPDWEGDNADEESEGEAAKTDDMGDTELIRTEGKPGWVEKVLKKAKAILKKKESDSMDGEEHTSGSPTDTQLDEIPSGPFNTLKNAFGTLGSKATGAKKGLTALKGKWNTLSFGDRAVMTQTLQSAASNIDKFAKAGDDPIGAVQGALNMVGQFAALAGPTGQIVAVALSFVSGFLSLFGIGGKKKKSIGQIVREEIDEALAQFYEQDLSNQARGIAKTFDVSKAYVDRLAQSGNKLTVAQAGSLERNVPLYLGLEFMGTLSSEIERLLRANKRNEAKKTLRYIELYAKMAVLKDVIMQEVATLLPDELEPNRQAMFAAHNVLRDQQKELVQFLRAGRFDKSHNKMAVNYFDPDVNPVTDAYMTAVLKIPDYDRSMAGIWCLTPVISGKRELPTTWLRKYDNLMAGGHPYITPYNEGCFWKLIPHGNHLYTVVNTYGGRKYDYYGQYMSFDILSGDRSRLTVESDADLWEIYGNHQKRIRSKWGCDSGNKWCNRQIQPQIESFGFWSTKRVTTFRLTSSNIGYIWWITKNPRV